MPWNVTVAAIVERAGRFLVVEELDPDTPAPSGTSRPDTSTRARRSSPRSSAR